jgi:hypothetical protein
VQPLLSMLSTMAPVQTTRALGSRYHAMARMASHWLHNTVARVQSQVRSCEIYGAKSGTGAGKVESKANLAAGHGGL